MAKTNYPKKKQKVNIDNIGLDLAQVPPQAVDVEEAVLGALLVEPSVVPDVMESLIAECFYKEANREIFNAISTIASRHEPVDIFTVTEALKKSDKLDLVGGPAYLAELSSKVGGAAHIETHSKILLQKYIQRELITISYDIQKESFEDTVPVDDLLDEAQGKIFSLAERNMKRETQPIKEIIQNTLGWQKSDLIILAARPAMGKTAFVLTMARNMTVEHKVPVAFFSLEMSSVQLVKRLMVSETGLSSQKIRGGIKMKDYEWVQLQEKLNALSEAPLYIDDTPSLSIYEFRSKARRMVQTAGVQLIIIDYLQLMTGPKELRGMREQEVSNISRSLKAIAKELNIPIIALSQLSRAVETRGGSKRPQLSDLRESGAIEQDADIVMFIHRPEYYGLVDDPQKQGLAEIIIAKHRNGSVQDVNMKFVPNEAKFVDANEMQFNSFPGDDGQMMESGMNSINDDLDGSNDFETQF